MSKKANLELIKALVEQGKTVKEIAIESGYADGTIRKHLKEMGKCVIVVSHSKVVEKYADITLELNNHTIIEVKKWEIHLKYLKSYYLEIKLQK